VSDVDLEAGVVHVTKAYDEGTKQTMSPKTRNGVRDVPFPEALRPVLACIVKARKPSEALVPGMGERSAWERARTLGAHRKKANVTRPRLTADNAREEAVDFRSLRDSGITWLALAGVDVVKIQRRAGHDDISTTVGYVKSAEDIAGQIGEPFPALPDELGSFGSISEFRRRKRSKTAGFR